MPDDRYTIEVQMTGMAESVAGKPMATGTLTLRSPDGQVHEFDFNSGGYGEYEESWLPGLDRQDCDLVTYELDWDNMAVESSAMPSGFTGPDGTGSWIALVSPRHFTDRGASPLGGSSIGSFGIHTDGNAPGSLGCIALSDSDAEELFEILENIPEEQRPLRINVLPPPLNFAPDNAAFGSILHGVDVFTGASQAVCESYIRTEFQKLSSVDNTGHDYDEFSMTANRAASLLAISELDGVSTDVMMGIWDLNSDKGAPEALSQGGSNWGMTNNEFANALLHHGPAIADQVSDLLDNSDIINEAQDIQSYTIVLRNYMADATGMDIDVPLDSPEADEYFAGLEIPPDMFTDPAKIAYIENPANYMRYHNPPENVRNHSLYRMTEEDQFTPETDYVERFELLSNLPFAETVALHEELVATADRMGIDPAQEQNGGRLYAAYKHNGHDSESLHAENYERHFLTNSNTGVAYALPFITSSLKQSVEENLSANPQAAPYDQIRASFIEAGVYENMDRMREVMATPILTAPVKPLALLNGEGLDVWNDLQNDLLDVDPDSKDGTEPSTAPARPSFDV